MAESKESFIESINFGKIVDAESGQEIIPVIPVQLGRVMMVGFMNNEALTKTLETGRLTMWSRSRQGLWTKGEQSGNLATTKRLVLDCDRDSLIVEVDMRGNPMCHTGNQTCFEDTDVIELELTDE